jgi:hypothetical protein
MNFRYKYFVKKHRGATLQLVHCALMASFLSMFLAPESYRWSAIWGMPNHYTENLRGLNLVAVKRTTVQVFRLLL